MKRTLVLGASPNPDRASNRAVHLLKIKGFEPVPVGIKKGEIAGIPILNGQPPLEDIDTVSLYLSPENQPQYYDYVFGLHPRRIIFNPGTENPELMRLAQENGIEGEAACTLVMLTVGVY